MGLSSARVARSHLAGTVYGTHVTTQENAKRILRQGFHIGGRGFFGPGVYLSLTLQDSLVYGHGAQGKATLVVEARPAKLARGRDYGDIKEIVGSEEVDRLTQDGMGSGDALGMAARKAGFDGMVLTDPDDDDGGPQVVLFNPSSVKRVALFDPEQVPDWAKAPSTGTHRFSASLDISKSVSHRKLYQWVEVPGRGRMTTDSPDGDDSFPPAVASYEAVGGWLVYTGRNGSEGIIVGPRAALTKWMADVDAMTSKYPLASVAPWDPRVHGGESNVEACLASAKEVLKKFGLPLKYTVAVSTDHMASSSAGNGVLNFVNVHKDTSADFLGGVSVPYSESCGAHEASHLGFSARHDRGHFVIDVLKERQRRGLPYLSTYHMFSGHMEGTAEAGAFYTLKPRVLQREAPDVYAAVAWWFGDGPRPGT